jgi:hypothetical protein
MSGNYVGKIGACFDPDFFPTLEKYVAMCSPNEEVFWFTKSNATERS